MDKVVRAQALLAGLWSGASLAVGGVAAPALFSILERQQAGAGAGQIFLFESRVSLAFAIILFVLERRRVRDEVEQGAAMSAMSVNLLLVLGALFLTVMGGFALQPMIQSAKAGEPTALSFAALHGISAALYWLKTLLVLSLAWRLTAR
jgi:hypothetical protein